MSRVPNISPSPRQQSIYKIADNVTGTYDLHDSLLISTVSGHIDITICLQPGDPQVPAELRLSSMSGSATVQVMNAAYGPKDFCDRDMITHISLISGSIHATLPHSYKTTLKTVSGGITANLHPHGSTTEHTDVVLENTSGTTNMTLHPHVADPRHPLTRLSTTYKGVTGSVKLTYKLTWQGQVEVHAQCGTVKRDWPGLRVTRDGPEMSAIVGEGEGRIWVGGTSNVELVGKAFGFAARPPAEAAETAADDPGNLPAPTYGEAMKG
jgi:hypothetical protein